MSAAATAIATVRVDLQDVQEDLDLVLSNLRPEQWTAPTPAEGWDIRDQLAHIALVEEYAAASVTDSLAFRLTVEEAAADPKGFEHLLYERGHAGVGPELLELWRSARTAVLRGTERLPEGSRVTWFGPSMSPLSFLTARLMETWAHGQDVRDALGLPPLCMGALRHVAHLGVRTRDWSYVVHGLDPDPAPVSVELSGPLGEAWSWGEPDALDWVRGTALDFALVVTQRRHWEDTGLAVEGRAARRWMQIAQAFAGPGTTTTPRRGLT